MPIMIAAQRRLLCSLLASAGLLAGCDAASRLETPLDEAAFETEPGAHSTESADSNRATHDWPRLFGPTLQSRSAETGLNWEWDAAGPPLLWECEIGTGYAAPVIRDEQLILFHRQGEDEQIASFDAESGQPQWVHRHPTSYACKYQYSSGPYATPVITEHSVLAWGAEGRFVCLDRATGEVLWERQLAEEFAIEDPAFGIGSSPLVEGDRIIVHTGGSSPNTGIVALDLATGATQWTSTDDGLGYASPIAVTVHGRRLLFVVTENGLNCVDPETGDLLWHYRFGIIDTPERVNSVTPLVLGEHVFLTQGPGPGSVLLKLLPDFSYEVVWKKRRVIDSQYTNVIPAGRLLFGVTGFISGRYRAVDRANGEVVWEHESDLGRANGLLVDRRLILLGEHGHLGVIDLTDADRPRMAWMSAEPLLESPCFSAPALARGRLYLRNEQRLRCYDLRGRPIKNVASRSVRQ